MKKVLFVIIFLSVATAGVFVYKELAQKAVIRSEISERSKRFLEKQKKEKGVLADKNIGDNTQKQLDRNITVDGCFRFVMPYAVRFSRTDGPCEVSYGLAKPMGTLVMYKREGRVGTFDQVPGVSMRRLHKDKYKEESKSIKNRAYLIFTQTQEEQVLSAFYFEPGFYFVVNVLGSTSDDTKEKLLQLLESVEF